VGGKDNTGDHANQQEREIDCGAIAHIWLFIHLVAFRMSPGLPLNLASAQRDWKAPVLGPETLPRR
jgi:hypothetical protein